MVHAGGWYHVINRGIERRAIYRDERDREHFLERLGEARGNWGRVHGPGPDAKHLTDLCRRGPTDVETPTDAILAT